MHMHTPLNIHVHVHVYINTYICIHTYIYIYIRIHSYIRTYTHIHTYIYIYIYIYIAAERSWWSAPLIVSSNIIFGGRKGSFSKPPVCNSQMVKIASATFLGFVWILIPPGSSTSSSRTQVKPHLPTATHTHTFPAQAPSICVPESAVRETPVLRLCINTHPHHNTQVKPHLPTATHRHCQHKLRSEIGCPGHPRFERLYCTRFANPHQPIPSKQQPAASSQKPAASSQQLEVGSKIAPKRPQDGPR